jgi:hypothetical protein
MKIIFTFFSLLFFQTIIAQKVKRNFFSGTLNVLKPYRNIKIYNNAGLGIQLDYNRKVEKVTYFTFGLSLNQMKNSNKIFYIGENLQNVAICDVSIGLSTKLYKKLHGGLNIGLGFASKHLTDASQFFFTLLKPTIIYYLNKKIDLRTSLYFGNANEDEYIFQSFGIGYTF